jgi:hypothetical protein
MDQRRRDALTQLAAANRADATIHVLFPDGHAHRHNAVVATSRPC